MTSYPLIASRSHSPHFTFRCFTIAGRSFYNLTFFSANILLSTCSYGYSPVA